MRKETGFPDGTRKPIETLRGRGDRIPDVPYLILRQLEHETSVISTSGQTAKKGFVTVT